MLRWAHRSGRSHKNPTTLVSKPAYNGSVVSCVKYSKVEYL